MKDFTFYWRTGKREVLQGETALDAVRNAGYGSGALRALDFISEGDTHNYAWDIEKREWMEQDTAYQIF